MVDVVERSAVYEMLDKIQQDVCEGYGFQLDKWVEYVDAMKCEKERIMTTEKFNNAYALFTKVGNTETKIKQLVKLKKVFSDMAKANEEPQVYLDVGRFSLLLDLQRPENLRKLIDEEIDLLELNLKTLQEEFEAL